MKAVIVEDEVIAAQALQELIREIVPEAEILAVLQSIDESTEWFQVHSMPDLVFMDIHLADGSSFAIFDGVKITCPIIFTTAYDEYALKAFEVNSIDYLLKPISKKDLERAINKYRHIRVNPTDNTELMDKLLASMKKSEAVYKSYLLVPEKDKLIPLPVSDIAYIFIDTKLVKAVTYTNRNYYLDQTLDELMDVLNPADFFRANRQYIIARKAIKDLSMWFGSKISVNLLLPTPEKIIVSKARVREVKDWIAG
ncbi:MAG: LytTR family DNA-binding domain-containing protein [Bacteroidales bacterium]|jgi:two-component system LytT family response regulator|nr:LytTR family DNA-binding domain-containing protein [Bacteroidales bacterium]